MPGSELISFKPGDALIMGSGKAYGFETDCIWTFKVLNSIFTTPIPEAGGILMRSMEGMLFPPL